MMPIRAENRHRYPDNWAAISRRIRFERAKGRCECTGECGRHKDIRCEAQHLCFHPETFSQVILTVAHLDQQPENCDDSNLKAMCQRCHNRLDGPYRRAGIRARLKATMAIGDLFDQMQASGEGA